MKHILTITALLFTAIGVNAQSFGGRVGVNFSNIIRTGDDNFETEFKPGLHAGITLDIPLVSSLSFAPELMYSQKGYKTTRSGLIGGDSEYSVTTNFIEVPILLKIRGRSGFNLHLGPQVSFLTSTTESFKSGNDEYRRRVKEQNENLSKNLIGGVVGLGFSAGARTNVIARYAIDFKKNNENGTSETPEYKNQVIQLGLGIKF